MSPPDKDPGLRPDDLLGRTSWDDIPAITVLAGDAELFKRQIIERFVRELFGDSPREVNTLQGPPNDKSLGDLPLANVLDNLRTLSFLSPRRLVTIHGADAFLRAHSKALAPHLESGFAGGHLILCVDRRPDRRTRLGKDISRRGWLVSCLQPFDRPPPWQPNAPAWDSPLSHWLCGHARTKGLHLDPQTAFALHDRVGADLSLLDEELDKIKIYLAEKGTSKIDAETVVAVSGDLREDSIFAVVDLFLEGRRADTIQAVERLFRNGYHSDSGLVVDPAGISLPLISTLLNRLRSLRRAHALSRTGAGPDDWIREGVVRKPFLSRFQRQLRATPPQRLVRLIDRLYDADRGIKTGGDPRRLVTLLVAE